MGQISEHRNVVNFDPSQFELMEMDGLPDEQVWWRNISYDQASGQGSYLMIMAPGTRSNPHRHNGAEEFYIVEGDLVDHDGHTYQMGEFVSLSGGSEHYSHTPSGCKLVVTHRGTLTTITHSQMGASS